MRLSVPLVLISCLILGRSAECKSGNEPKRASTAHHVIELLVVADYSFYKNWYDKTHDSSTSRRQQEAIHNIKEYVGALIHSSNKAYKSLESHGIYITIKPVDVLVMTTAHDSPWTETVKVKASPKYEVDPTRVLPLFQPKSVSLQSTIPHDHAMILTMYALYHGGGGTFSGYAYTDAECKAKSVSIIEDNEDFYTAQLIAHELGHSLGCEHDGEGNSCPRYQGYTMEASFILANKKKWTFSNCSVDYIRNYINGLNSAGTNCLLHLENHHPSSQMASFTNNLFGQVYNADEQCQMKYGTGSYLCRDRYYDDYSLICLKLKCYQPGKNTCYYIDGGDGMPCGNGKWCMSDECVADSRAPNVPDSCPAGDQPGVVKNGYTCVQLVQHDPTACTDQTIQYKCCDTCNKHAGNTSVAVSHGSIDDQCIKKHGSGSRMCRGGHNYDNLAYSDIVCRDLQCLDPNDSTWCLSSTADDGTPCGYKKWCQNARCVHDNNAPAVSDTCPWGDEQGVATYGLTCQQMKRPEHHWRCYDTFSSKVCCAACDSVRRNISGCQYGDKSDWCAYNIRSQYDRRTCYYGHNSDLCCETCAKYENPSHRGCEYGDKISGCRASSCSRYDATKRAQCCDTCRSTAIIG